MFTHDESHKMRSSSNKMKVFVWDNELTGYTGDMMVAVAETIEEARAELQRALPSEYDYIPYDDLYTQPMEFDLTEPIAFIWHNRV